jgi:phosphatidylserine/phosphatidylglycerophosphate/cardiolipin synthase-like enzyme
VAPKRTVRRTKPGMRTANGHNGNPGGSIRAFSNNDVALVVWHYQAPIEDCLGFEIRRVEKTAAVPLPAWVGFAGDHNTAWQPRTTRDWPVQKFSWKDLTAKPGGTYSYQIVPRIGTPGALRDADAALHLISNEVTLTPRVGDGIRAYFNRGILSTQHLVHQVPSDAHGRPNFRVLTERIDQPGDPLRASLLGQMLDGFRWMFEQPDASGALHAALYELNDPELLQLLYGAKDRLNLVLSNTGDDDKLDQPARQSLHEYTASRPGAIVDRMLASGHIGHNKFLVASNADDEPIRVATGSTNWTDTALCAQSNNLLILDSATIAGGYVDYWKRLVGDDAEQGPQLRTSDHGTPLAATIDGADVTVWFSPNTKQQNKPAHNPTEPVDLHEVFRIMRAAKKAVLFLVFQPGTPSVFDVALEIANDPDSHVFVRGAATDPKAVSNFDTQLIHRPGMTEDIVVAASAVRDQFGYWQTELLKSSPGAHAIIHDKIVVVDPTEADCCVITGSHNLGYRASYNNDENLVIVRGHRALAQAYAVHVLDIYDHYRFRYSTQQNGLSAYRGLDRTADWQAKYFDKKHDASRDDDWWR